MNMAGVVNRVMARDLSYVLGRFHTVRSAYGSLRHTLEAMKPASRDTAHKPSTLFPDADVNGIVRSIRDEAVFIGLNLPPATVEAIKSFALTEPLHAIYDPKGPTFRYADVTNGVAAMPSARQKASKSPLAYTRSAARAPHLSDRPSPTNTVPAPAGAMRASTAPLHVPPRPLPAATCGAGRGRARSLP